MRYNPGDFREGISAELKPSQLREWLHEWSASRRAARAKGPTLRFSVVRVARDTVFETPRQTVVRGIRNSRLKRLQLRRSQLITAQGHACYLCSEPFTNLDPATLDHVVPKAAGGLTYRNVLAAHCSCNGRKGDRMPTREELAYLKAMNERLGA